MQDSTLHRFEADLNRIATLSGYIEKALALADSFRPQVVDKVVNGHRATLAQLALDLMPVVIELEDEVREHQDALAALGQLESEARRQLDELELRQLIGEMNADDFLDEAAPHQAALDSVAARRAPHERSIARASEELGRWQTLGAQAGVLQAESASA
jgi:chromosome segregation ATPase